MKQLVALGATCAVLGGALRILAAFIPYAPNAPGLEALYGVIDVCLLLALLGLFLREEAGMGTAFLSAFVVAFVGLASIVGPDATQFGIDFYQLGSLVFVVGLALMSTLLLRRRRLILPALLWLGTAASTAAVAVTASPIAFILAGVTLGAGFMVAGGRRAA